MWCRKKKEDVDFGQKHFCETKTSHLNRISLVIKKDKNLNIQMMLFSGLFKAMWLKLDQSIQWLTSKIWYHDEMLIWLKQVQNDLSFSEWRLSERWWLCGSVCNRVPKFFVLFCSVQFCFVRISNVVFNILICLNFLYFVIILMCSYQTNERTNCEVCCWIY
jgi:hypothetical protein